jgi:AbrB family looped-hinge helix DNA binding protein
METTIVSNKGQVTIPKELRKRLGIAKGSTLVFSVVGDHIELRLLDRQVAEPPVSGFGMLKSKRRAIPADFDPATLLGAEENL